MCVVRYPMCTQHRTEAPIYLNIATGLQQLIIFQPSFTFQPQGEVENYQERN